MTDKVMVEAFRGDASLVMPEIFYQASKGLKDCGPLIEPFRGDE